MDLDGGMQKRRGKTHGLLAAETAGCFFFFYFFFFFLWLPGRLCHVG